ncbi:MAG TPA: hypothetical protein VKN18_25780 [Blastocatellia bacterium]|nr:hypothetical protein [Blastocatellia bacterium]
MKFNQIMNEKDDKPAGFYLKPDSIQKEVTFVTEDGWTISGSLTIPSKQPKSERRPAVLLLHSSMHSRSVWVSFPGWAKLQESVVTLRIDIRGRGKSEGGTPFIEMPQAERDKVVLDVRAALDFIGTQDEVDHRRIGVVAEEFSAGPAVIGAMQDSRVGVLVLLSGILSQSAMEVLAGNRNKPMLFIVSKEDKRGFADMTKAYSLNKNPQSDIWVQDGLGVGVTMCNMWRNRYADRPIENALDFAAGAWLEEQLRLLGNVREITIETEDGWILYANLGLPEAIDRGQTVPGVILLPTALTDRNIYRNLERLLLANNIAFLNLEYRGIGKSINKGSYIDQSLAEIMAGRRDLHRGYQVLTSCNGVDADRIGVLGALLAANYALNGAKENPNLRAIGMLDPVVWAWSDAGDRDTLSSIKQPVLVVTGDGMGELTRNFASTVAENYSNKVLTYPGSIVAYLRFREDRELEPTIVSWFKKQLEVHRSELKEVGVSGATCP